MSKIAIIFPGMGYHSDKPLLYYGKKIATEMGYQIVEVTYSGFESNIRGKADNMKEAAEHAFAQAEAILDKIDFNAEDEILCISKSVGTVVAAMWQKKKGIAAKNIFYTPVEGTFFFAAADSGIAFHGTNDPWVTTGIVKEQCKRLHLPLFITKDGNHSLEIGEAYTDACTIAEVVGQVQKFLSNVCPTGSLDFE